jgi:hypothetical protein
LRVFFPSVKELEEELQDANTKMEACIASKDFSNAEKLHDEINKLEMTIAVEMAKQAKLSPPIAESSLWVTDLDGNQKEFVSRYDLEEAIKENKEMQSNAISSKKFKKAESIQSIINSMENLRKCLPTVDEIEKEVIEKRAEMQKALDEKRFSDAETLDKQVTELEEKLTKEKSKLPKPAVAKAKENAMQNKIGGTVHSTPAVGARASNGAPLQPKILFKTPKVVTSKSTPSFGRNDSNISDITSLASSKARSVRKLAKKVSKLDTMEELRPVSKLRPKKPLISSVDDSVLSVAQMLTSKRGDASLVVSKEGGLAGIITDTGTLKEKKRATCMLKNWSAFLTYLSIYFKKISLVVYLQKAWMLEQQASLL